MTRSCAFLLLLPILAAAQVGPEDLVKSIAPAVASVITATTPGTQWAAGSAVVVRADGVLLTALALVRNTGQVSIRLQNGEIYDQVDLIGFDERRGIAALRIPASGLTAAAIENEEGMKSGGPAWVVPHPGAQAWKAIRGQAGALKVADEIPGAGAGYRVWPVQAAAPPGTSGAPLVTESGKVVGILTAGSGDGMNLAVPIVGVIGLANGTAKISLNTPAGRAAAGQFGRYQPPVATSASLANLDPQQILQTAKSLMIYSKTVYCKPDQLTSALHKLPEFQKLGLLVVSNASTADLSVLIDRPLFTFDYTFSVVHIRSGIVLGSGKVLAGDGAAASKGIAKQVLNLVQEALKSPAPVK